jgi:hypothetical protein
LKAIDIQINQAKIKSFEVSFNEEGLPDVTARIALLTGNKEISSFTLSTESWQTKNTFELPTGVINPIKKIGEELETILIRQCSAAIGQLGDGRFG